MKWNDFVFKSAVYTLMLAVIVLLVSWVVALALRFYSLSWQTWRARRVMS